MAQVTLNNRIHTVPEGTRLSALLPDLPHPCGGKGVCGKCKVRAWGELSPLSSEEQRHLTALEITDGIRLACCTMVQGACRVQTRSAEPMVVCLEGEAPARVRPGFARYGAAVDIGTTTLAAQLYAADGALLAEIGAPNPQAAFGADVISRVEATLKGSPTTKAIRTGLSRLLTALTAQAGLAPGDLDEIVITGNTVMLTLLTGRDVTPFATAPFTGHSRFGERISLPDYPGVAVYLAPCVSAFIGGDTATALLATDLNQGELLLDIGTNGEMVLNANGKLYACSTAAGPAFEGVGISCGMVAAPGAIDRVELVNGALYPHVIGGAEATGVCGSGLVDGLACLAMLGETAPVPLAPGISLTAEDVAALLTSKSAIRSGIDTLLHTAGMPVTDLTGIKVAGGFGRYLNIQNAIHIGLLPPILPERIDPVGNAALSGAVRLLLDTALRETASRLLDAVEVVDLAQSPYFATRFFENMTLEVPQ
ncbi:MAG: DUF4445 domain-containing protein [Ruminococcaceae bacterium]|nr:DUF4445 domain-containing protein [Oscillospiraceae bacterium]